MEGLRGGPLDMQQRGLDEREGGTLAGGGGGGGGRGARGRGAEGGARRGGARGRGHPAPRDARGFVSAKGALRGAGRHRCGGLRQGEAAPVHLRDRAEFPRDEEDVLDLAVLLLRHRRIINVFDPLRMLGLISSMQILTSSPTGRSRARTPPRE